MEPAPCCRHPRAVCEPLYNPSLTDGRHLRWIIAGSIAVYLVWAALLIAQRPGLQYDEALLVVDSVHMLHSRAEVDLPHLPGSWICPPGRCLPLMTSMYVGPAKAYLSLPLFAIFGVHVEVVRLISVFLAALLIWGVATLVGEAAGPPAAAAAALVIAMNPAYVDLTVFDNDAVAPMVAATGLLCWSIARYLRRRDIPSAIWIGASVGVGIWARANHLFFLAAAGAAVLMVMRRKLLAVPVSHWMAMAAGASLAGAPFLIYQLRSGGATWQGLDTFAVHQSLGERMSSRLIELAEGLLSDREHRAMWDAPGMPGWQRWLFLPMALAACAVPFVLWTVVARAGSERAMSLRKIALARIAAITFVILAAVLLTARVQIAEHHMVALLPAAAIVVAFAGVTLARSRLGAALAALAAVVYFGSAMYWQIGAVEGLARTGGVGMWSDGVYRLADGLARNYPGRPITTPDWGLSYNVYVLSNTKVRMSEWHEPWEGVADVGRFWANAVAAGGVFVLNAPDHRFFPEASRAFLRALDQSHVPFRTFTLTQRDGGEFVEVFEVGAAVPEHVTRGGLSTAISMTDEGSAPQLQGFYAIEEGKRRWTQPQFSITLGRPDLSWGSTARLSIQLQVPEIVVQRLGKLTLSVRLNQHVLAPETISRAGDVNFARAIPADWLTDANTFQFSLNKSLPPSASDPRELGVIVRSASLGQ
jgi:4-amino-4-deoxy-L-arabinose transferase-like glycosyltransferase